MGMQMDIDIDIVSYSFYTIPLHCRVCDIFAILIAMPPLIQSPKLFRIFRDTRPSQTYRIVSHILNTLSYSSQTVKLHSTDTPLFDVRCVLVHAKRRVNNAVHPFISRMLPLRNNSCVLAGGVRSEAAPSLQIELASNAGTQGLQLHALSCWLDLVSRKCRGLSFHQFTNEILYIIKPYHFSTW